jgi:hypothetical protein
MKRGLSIALVLAVTTLGLVGTSLSEPISASADSTITCGGITCSAEGAVFGDGSNDNGGGNSSGTGGSTKTGGGTVTNSFEPCQGWEDVNAGLTTTKYPANYIAQGATDYGCFLGYSLGIGYTCPVGANGVPSLGRVDTTITIKVNGKKVTTDTGWRCYYPAGADVPIPVVTSLVCYTSGNAWFYQNGQQTGDGVGQYRVGTQLSSYPGGAKSTGWSSSNPTANCGGINLSFAAQTEVTNGVPVYGYYTMNFSTTYVIVTHSVLPAVWKIPASNSISNPLTNHYSDPYTYSCQLNPALQTGINTSVSFDPATCAGGTWACTLSNLTLDGTSKAVSTMRNGKDIAVKGSTLAVSGAGVRNVTNPEYKWDLAPGATPRNPDALNINGTNQYFKLITVAPNGSRQQENMEQWLSNPNANQNKLIDLYWASDPTKPFVMTEGFGFTGQFLVNTQAGIGSGTTKQWVTDFAQCGNSVTSNPDSVLRSVNND